MRSLLLAAAAALAASPAFADGVSVRNDLAFHEDQCSIVINLNDGGTTMSGCRLEGRDRRVMNKNIDVRVEGEMK